MTESRTIVAPTVVSDFAKAGPLAYWKQVLPQRQVHYTTKSGKRAVLNFDQKYLTDLANAFHQKVLDQTPFLLANADNAHTMDPERFRGQVVDMRLAREGEPLGLYAKIAFPSEAAAQAVLTNPNLGVSARIREGVDTPDGSVVPRAMIHVLGTLDPQVTGMAPWVPAVDLSFDPNDMILDLSGATVAENELPGAEASAEEIDALTEEQLDQWIEQYAPELLTADPEEVVDEHEDPEHSESPESPEGSHEKELEPALSAKAQQDIELATQRATAAEERANEALRQMAEAKWETFQSKQLDLGVEPWVLDLAKPVLNRPESMTIDLSNEGGESLDVGSIVRKLVEGYKGTVDLSKEQGHSGVTVKEGDPDAEMMAMWDAQFEN
jgi:NACalpha-BTF3-like transcription factor